MMRAIRIHPFAEGACQLEPRHQPGTVVGYCWGYGRVEGSHWRHDMGPTSSASFVRKYVYSL